MIDFCGQNKGEIQRNVFAFILFKENLWWRTNLREKDKGKPQEGAICFECFSRVRITRSNRCNQIVCSCYCHCVFSLTCEVAIIFSTSLSPAEKNSFLYHFSFTTKLSRFGGLSRKWSFIVLEVQKIGWEEQSFVGSFILVKVLNLFVHWVCNISKHFTLYTRELSLNVRFHGNSKLK